MCCFTHCYTVVFLLRLLAAARIAIRGAALCSPATHWSTHEETSRSCAANITRDYFSVQLLHIAYHAVVIALLVEIVQSTHLMHPLAARAALNPRLNDLLRIPPLQQMLLMYTSLWRFEYYWGTAIVAFLAPKHLSIRSNIVHTVLLNSAVATAIAHKDRRLQFQALLATQQTSRSRAQFTSVQALTFFLNIH